jgi:hypothetical protein
LFLSRRALLSRSLRRKHGLGSRETESWKLALLKESKSRSRNLTSRALVVLATSVSNTQSNLSLPSLQQYSNPIQSRSSKRSPPPEEPRQTSPHSLISTPSLASRSPQASLAYTRRRTSTWPRRDLQATEFRGTPPLPLPLFSRNDVIFLVFQASLFNFPSPTLEISSREGRSHFGIPFSELPEITVSGFVQELFLERGKCRTSHLAKQMLGRSRDGRGGNVG